MVEITNHLTRSRTNRQRHHHIRITPECGCCSHAWHPARPWPLLVRRAVFVVCETEDMILSTRTGRHWLRVRAGGGLTSMQGWTRSLLSLRAHVVVARLDIWPHTTWTSHTTRAQRLRAGVHSGRAAGRRAAAVSRLHHVQKRGEERDVDPKHEEEQDEPCRSPIAATPGLSQPTQLQHDPMRTRVLRAARRRGMKSLNFAQRG